jgi:hypothetical protein
MHNLTKNTAKGIANICLLYARRKINREQIVFIFYANIKVISIKAIEVNKVPKNSTFVLLICLITYINAKQQHSLDTCADS